MQKLHPRAVWLFFFGYVARWFLVVVILSWMLLGTIASQTADVPSFRALNWLWIILPSFLVVLFLWAKLAYHFYRYEATENGFRKESGVIYKRYVTIPYDRIQNVDIYRGILARLLGLSDLQIQTAGASVSYSRYGAGAEGRLPGLLHADAERLRDELIQRARQPRDQGI